MPREVPDRITRRRFLAAAGLGVAGLSGYGALSNELEATRSAVPRWPADARAPLRLALATDMHGPHHLIDLAALVRTIAEFQPHVLCVVGDAVDNRGDEGLVSLYGAVQAPLGKFAVLGNWEYEGECDIPRLERAYAHAGVDLLINRRVTLDHAGEPIDIVGLDDILGGSPDLRLIDTLRPGDATAPRAIALSHCPRGFDSLVPHAPRPIVTLAGHTHGGQIAPLGVALVLPTGSGHYVKGWYVSRHGSHHLYVSRGLGNSGPPFRIGSRPEIALLTL
jgi:hypothetical protein